MKKPSNPRNLALKVTFSLHNDLLEDEGFAGYEGTKEQFDDLYEEVLTIITKVLGNDGNYPDENQIVEAYWEIQTEIVKGIRQVDWFLN
jgi:hypothetical protein